jgi:hypothetical protein
MKYNFTTPPFEKGRLGGILFIIKISLKSPPAPLFQRGGNLFSKRGTKF